MQIAKTVTLVFSLVFAGLVLEMSSPRKVLATDKLAWTKWANDDDMFALFFKEEGEVDLLDGAENGVIKGSYRGSNAALEMTFQNGTRARATVKGDKMSIRFTRRDGSTEDSVLSKE